MANKFNADQASVDRGVTQLRASKDDIANVLGKLRNCVAGTQWKGESAEEFQQTMQRYDNDAKQLTAALEGIANLMHTSNSTFTANEAQTKSDMRVDYTLKLGH